MIVEEAYLVGVYRYSFRAGEPGKIIGVDIITTDGGTLSPCYHIKWGDGIEDWTPIENGSHKIISFKDILAGNTPTVTE